MRVSSMRIGRSKHKVVCARMDLYALWHCMSFSAVCAEAIEGTLLSLALRATLGVGGSSCDVLSTLPCVCNSRV